MLPAESAAGPPLLIQIPPPSPLGVAAQRHHLLQRGGVVAQHPAVVGLDVAVAAEGEVDHAVAQQQRRPLILSQRVEGELPALRALPGPGHAGLDQHRSAELLGPGGDIEGVQALDVAGDAPETSLVLATTYSVPLAGSITGVLVMPISGVMSQHSPVSLDGTVVTLRPD